MTVAAKVGHFQDGKFHELASGSEEYCRGFLDGYNLYSHIDATMLVGDRCQCGPARVEIKTDGDSATLPRTGCLRCARWDGPVQIRPRGPRGNLGRWPNVAECGRKVAE
jgi:hypothetical protein